MQIKYINRALQRFDATQVIPVQFVLFTLSVIGGSAVLYRDFERTSGEDAGKFVGGCALTFFGVWLITSGRPERSGDEEECEPEPEGIVYSASECYNGEVDGRSDGIIQNTRRSSTVRPLSPPININSRYRDDDSRPSTPEIRVLPDPVTPQNSGRPATSDIMSSIIVNPWTHINEPGYRTPPLNRHTSTPVLPSEAAPPPLVSVSDPELAPPRTPIRGKSHNELPVTPGSQPPLRRLRTGDRVPMSARNSIAGPLLASPLSTSLSTMVQDLKRGGSIRRQHSALGLRARDGDNGMLILGEPLTRRQTRESLGPSEGAEGAVTPVRMARGRSLSGTLNELWRGIRGQGSREDMTAEEAVRDAGREA